MIEWERGGGATIVEFSQARAVVRSTCPAAPGTPLVGVVGGGERLELKVKSCRRDGDVWIIEGRPFNLTRALRERLSSG